MAALALLPSVACRAPEQAVQPGRVWDDWWGGDRGETLTVPVTANDRGVVSTTVIEQPRHGTLHGPDGSHVYTYRPQPDWTGTDRFVYRAAIRDGAWVDATVTLTVSSPKTVVAADNVPLYGVWERSVENDSSYANPFDFREIELQGSFTAPSGITTRFFGFHDGDGNGGQAGNRWKIRFMPAELGVYSYALSFSDGAPIEQASGAFTVVDSPLPGPPSLLGDRPPRSHFLKDARGNPIAWKGYGIFGVTKLVDINAQEEEHYYRGIVEDQLIGQGYNATMVSDGRGWFDDFIADPVGGSFDLARLTRGDRLIDLLAANGVWAVNWTCFVGDQDLWDEFFADGRFEPVVRHFVGRYAPFYNYFGWSPSWETWEEHDQVRPDDQGHTEAVAAYLRAISPWDKLPTAHDRARPDWSTWQRIQLRQNQSRRIADGNNRHIGAFDGYAYVIVGAEDLWERAGGALGQPRNGKEVRDAAWGELLAGVLTLYYEWFSFTDGPAAGPGRGEGDAFYRIAVDLWYDRTTWYDYSMKNALVGLDSDSARASGWTGREYVICDQNGGANSLDLREAPGTFRLAWWDPTAGRIRPGGAVRGGDTVLLQPPAAVSSEWCAFLELDAPER